MNYEKLRKQRVVMGRSRSPVALPLLRRKKGGTDLLLLLSPQQALNHQPDRMFGLGLHMVVIIIYAERVGGGCCGGVMMDGKD